MLRRTMVLVLLPVLCSLFSVPASPALDPEVRKPYSLTVVLKVAEHPLLTQVFKDQLARELGDILQDALGTGLVEVKVVREHPILDEIAKLGLQQALDNCKSEQPDKVHVVLIDYVLGNYEIQAGQYDGLTGLPSAVVRRTRLEDPAGRQLVARTAAQFIEGDFGLVGTVVDNKSPNKIGVLLRGSQLGVPLAGRVQKGEVFAVVQVNRLGGTQRVRDTLLQVVEPPDTTGRCVCRLLARHQEDPASQLASQPGVLGYRCIKLGTTRAPLRLRLINERGLGNSGLQVEVGTSGFEDATLKGSTARDGSFTCEERFSHVAFVVVRYGKVLVAPRLPIPIIEDQVAVRTVVLDPEINITAPLIAQRDRYVRRLDDCIRVIHNLGESLHKRLNEKKYQEALDLAKESQGGLQRDQRDLEAERTALSVDVNRAKLDDAKKKNLLYDGGRMAHLESGIKNLKDFIESWEKRIKLEGEAVERHKYVTLARAAKEKAEFEEARNLYKDALKLGSEAQLLREFQELEEGWKVKTATHAAARKYIYETWANIATAAKLAEQLPSVQKNFNECKIAEDKLTPRKIQVAGLRHIQVLEEQRARLRPDLQDERERLEQLKTTAEGLKKLLEEVNAYVSGK
jgi:hypothetical protein